MVNGIPNHPPVFAARHEEDPVRQLTRICLAKHEQNGKFVSQMIRLASLIASLYILWLAPAMYAFESLVAAAAVYYAAGPLLNEIYHTIRNRDYLDAVDALETDSFKDFLDNHNLTPTIGSIVVTHKLFEARAQDQLERLERQHAERLEHQQNQAGE